MGLSQITQDLLAIHKSIMSPQYHGVDLRAFAARCLRVHFGDATPVAEVLEVTMHEMLHVWLETRWLHTPREQRSKRRPSHGRVFRETLCEAARRMWGVEIDPRAGKVHRKVARTNWWSSDGTLVRITEHREIQAYALDRLIVETLQKALDSGALTLQYVATGRSY